MWADIWVKSQDLTPPQKKKNPCGKYEFIKSFWNMKSNPRNESQMVIQSIKVATYPFK